MQNSKRNKENFNAQILSSKNQQQQTFLETTKKRNETTHTHKKLLY